MVWKAENPQGTEQAKVRWDIVPYTRGRVLDLGCGPNKAFPHFIGVDNGHHERFGYSIKPDLMVQTCEKLDLFASQSCDAVFSSHLLEHIDKTEDALREWWRVVKVNGYLVLYLPHKDFYPNMGQPGANPDHKHDFAPQDIVDAMKSVASGFDLVENEDRNGGEEYSFFQVYKKVGSKGFFYSYKNPKPEKTAAVIRYGAFGDLMQASSVLYGLKKAGYHVTLYSSPPGSDVVLHDPNIDQLILQDKDQVPNGNLAEFWAHIEKKYDKFVNLSESVEGTWLAMEGRIQGTWSDRMRRRLMNENYLAFQHEIADIPYWPNVKFYATAEERAWAKKQASVGEFNIIWSLAGSAVHKTWPYLDNILAKLMLLDPKIHVFLVGGPECEILESGWQHEARIHKTSGKWGIRNTLAFLYEADLVIGPETGVLNAASCMDIPKVVFLSHSSHENLTRDWTNTTALHTSEAACYPCHRLHYSWAKCHKDEETGSALCQSTISAHVAWRAINAYVREKYLEAA